MEIILDKIKYPFSMEFKIRPLMDGNKADVGIACIDELF